jgi:hypothetical protein
MISSVRIVKEILYCDDFAPCNRHALTASSNFSPDRDVVEQSVLVAEVGRLPASFAGS